MNIRNWVRDYFDPKRSWKEGIRGRGFRERRGTGTQEKGQKLRPLVRKQDKTMMPGLEIVQRQ